LNHKTFRRPTRVAQAMLTHAEPTARSNRADDSGAAMTVGDANVAMKLVSGIREGSDDVGSPTVHACEVQSDGLSLSMVTVEPSV
jgi:hypothetical protein